MILEILAAEAEAGRIVAEAGARGRALVSGAKEKAAKQMETSSGEARLAAERALASALEEAAREKAARLAAASAGIEDSLRAAEKGRRAAVELVIKAVLGV